MNGNHLSQRGVWLAIIVLGSLYVAVAAGVLFHVAGAEPYVALGAGGAAFVGTAGLGFTAHRFVTG